MSRLQYWLKASHLLLRYLVLCSIGVILDHYGPKVNSICKNSAIVQKQQWILSKYVQYCVRLNMDRWINLICPIRCSLHIYISQRRCMSSRQKKIQIFWHVTLCWHDVTSRRLESSTTLLWEPQVLQVRITSRSWKNGFRNLWLDFTYSFIMRNLRMWAGIYDTFMNTNKTHS